MANLEFKRTKENFTCGHCGASVTGTGYTNHCPVCLWSKHVDVFPGDREETCSGMMEPVDAFQKHSRWFIVQSCIRCKREWVNEVQKEDNFDVVIKISKKDS